MYVYVPVYNGRRLLPLVHSYVERITYMVRELKQTKSNIVTGYVKFILVDITYE